MEDSSTSFDFITVHARQGHSLQISITVSAFPFQVIKGIKSSLRMEHCVFWSDCDSMISHKHPIKYT